MKIIGLGREGLLEYVVLQIAHFFPDGRHLDARKIIDLCLDEALSRLSHCIDSVRIWEPGVFNYLQSTQYCTFLYYLGNTVWRNGAGVDVPTKIFLLNKALNGIDLFYEIEMPSVFLIGHSVGIVLAKACYGNYFVIFQNSTVGKSHGVSPVIGERVVMYPNTSVLGKSVIGDGVVISQGVSVINKNVMPAKTVFSGGRDLVCKGVKNDILNDFFRL